MALQELDLMLGRGRIPKRLVSRGPTGNQPHSPTPIPQELPSTH